MTVELYRTHSGLVISIVVMILFNRLPSLYPFSALLIACLNLGLTRVKLLPEVVPVGFGLLLRIIGSVEILFPLTGSSFGALFKSEGFSASATIMTGTLLAPLTLSAGYHRYLQPMPTVGSGAMTVSHENDSNFQFVRQLGGLPRKNALGTWTLNRLLQKVTTYYPPAYLKIA